MPQVTGILESALFVGNLERARDFYGRVFGFEELEVSEDGCVLMVGKVQVFLLVTAAKALIASRTPGGTVPPCLAAPREAVGAGHMAFAVTAADLDAWRAHLEREGVQVESEVAWQGGARSLYFRDPDGHLLELATPGIWGIHW
ncbi:MAG TPA: VOC family protein [Bryobacteraceae bacterium]|nr:VOC family protein [Bryobacteraceae bacterium]